MKNVARILEVLYEIQGALANRRLLERVGSGAFVGMRIAADTLDWVVDHENPSFEENLERLRSTLSDLAREPKNVQ